MQRLERSIDTRFPPHGGAAADPADRERAVGVPQGAGDPLDRHRDERRRRACTSSASPASSKARSEYALLFGLWTAFIEVIPYIGPWLSAVPPLIFALFVDPPWGVLWVGAPLPLHLPGGGAHRRPERHGERAAAASAARDLRAARGRRALRDRRRARRAADDGRPARDLGVLPRAASRSRAGTRAASDIPVEVEIEPPRAASGARTRSPPRVGDDRGGRRRREPALGRGASCPTASERPRAGVLAAGPRGARARARDDLRGLSRPLRALAAVRARRRGHGAPARRLPLRARARPRRRDRGRRGRRRPRRADLALRAGARRRARRRRRGVGRDGVTARRRRPRRRRATLSGSSAKRERARRVGPRCGG